MVMEIGIRKESRNSVKVLVSKVTPQGPIPLKHLKDILKRNTNGKNVFNRQFLAIQA
jgi:hypothetical protein